jgi:iron complex outermembrane receptor protein
LSGSRHRNLNKTRILLILISLLAFPAVGQEETKGQIVDRKTGDGVPFALIQYGHGHERTTADSNGFFALRADEPTLHLHVQAIGYQHLHLETETTDSLLIIELSPENYLIDEVTVSVDRKSPTTSTSATVLLADRDQLREQWTNTLSTTLLDLPGVQSMTTGVGIGKPVIRGLLGARLQVNVNGIKQEGHQWGMDHGLEVDPFSVEQVEVVKGAQALAYGSDATGGVINLRPSTLPTAKWSVEATTFYQSVNQSFGATAQTTYRGERGWVKGRLSGQSFGDYSVPAETFTYNSFLLEIENEQLKNTAGEQWSAQLEGGVNRGAHDFEGRLSYYDQRVGIFPGAIGIPRAYQLADDGNRRNIDLPYQDITHVRASVHHHYHGSEWQWVNDLGVQHNHREERSFPHLHGVTPDSSNTLALGLELTTATINTRAFQYKGNHKRQWGVQGEVQKNRRNGFEFLIPNYERWLAGAYFIDEWTNGRHSFNAGVRLDFAHYDIDGHYQAIYDLIDGEVVQVDSSLRAQSNQINFPNISAAIGWAYNWTDQFSTKVNAARTFRAPNIAELSANGVHHGTFRHEVGNQENEAEIGYQFDGELTWRDRRWSIQVSPFFNYFTNFLFLRPTAEFSPLPEAGQLFVYEQAPAVHTGSELAFTWLMTATQSFDLGAEYVYGFNLDENLPLPFMPPLSALTRWRAEWHIHFLGSEDWNTEIRYRATAAQNQVDRNERSTPSYGLLHIAIGNEWSVNESRLGLRFEVRNLLDQAYLQHLSRYRYLNLPEPGRNFTVQLYCIF